MDDLGLVFWPAPVRKHPFEVLTDLIRAVAAKEHLRAIGQEVFSLEADAMPPEEAGRVAGKTAWAAFRAAGVAVPVTGNGVR